jgi:release factor glutamine methyltransferase
VQARTRAPIPSYADLLREAEGALGAEGIETARLDAEVLLAAAMDADRAALYRRLREGAAEPVRRRFESAVARRCGREPVAFITGVREIWSLPIRVTPATLIPRPESELLVASTLEMVAGRPAARIWDVGTGSGCLAVALAYELPRARIVATDVSHAALEVARRNAAALGVAGRIDFAGADLAAGLSPRRRFDLVVSNPPYVPEDESLSPELAWEPAGALCAGRDGLDVIRRLLPQAAARLGDGGFLVMELGFGQEQSVRRLATEAGFAEVRIRADYAGIPRVLVAGKRERCRSPLPCEAGEG